MEVLILSIAYAKIVERLIIHLSYIFYPFTHCILTGFQVSIDKWKSSVLKVESNGNRAFVSSHAWEASFNFDFTNVFNAIL